MPRRFAAVAGLAALSFLIGCGSKEPAGASAGAPAAAAAPEPAASEPEAAPVVASAAAQDEATKIFGTRCFTCHGSEGMGDGPGSAALDPKPRNFHDATWQASVSDEHIAKIIQFGGAAVGKSPSMPGNPDLMSKPEVVAALVAHVRSLGAAQ